jgi:hypothetical protein
MSHQKAVELPEGGFKLKNFDNKGSFVGFSDEVYPTEEEAFASRKPDKKKKEELKDALPKKKPAKKATKKKTTKKKD